MGGTKYRGLWGKGWLAAVVDGVFLRVGGTKRGPVGTGERFLASGSSPGASGVPSAGLCLRGRGALRAGRLGRQRSAEPVSAPPSKGSRHSRVTPALCEENSAGFTSGLCAVGVIGGRGQGSDGAVLSEEALREPSGFG